MELKGQFRKEYFAKAKEDGCVVNGQMFVEVEKELYIEWLETKLRSTPSNNDYAKLPTIEECYHAIPFPSSEPDCVMFVAGIADCHKFVSRHFA